MANRDLRREAAAYTGVGLLAVLLNQFYGTQGYMPLDQSIVYNGAWRLLNGQMPYVDFGLPFGLVPILLQAALFKAFDVSWTVYVLQASLFNALFASSILFLGRRLGLGLGMASLYAALAAVVAYPPMGTPYIDQHATIFSAWLLAATLLGIVDRGWGAGKGKSNGPGWWWLAPPLALLALFSKPMPSALATLVATLALVLAAVLQRRARDLVLVTGAAAAWLVIVAATLGLAGVDWAAFAAQALEAPLSVAVERAAVAAAGTLPGGAHLPDETFSGDMLARRALVAAIHGFALLPVLAALVAAARSRTVAVLTPALFAAGSFGIAMLFMALTRNQPVSALALVAQAWLLAHVALQRGAPRFAKTAAAIATAVSMAMLVEWVMPRYLNDFEGTVPAGPDGAIISPQLEHLRWSMPPSSASLDDDSADSYRRLVAELAAAPVTPVILSDSILYPLIARTPVPPALFWHRGLSFPADGRARDAFDAQFRRNILAAGSDLVVMDGPRTWMSVRLDDFPWLTRCLHEDRRREIGRFLLIPLDRDCLAR